MKSGRAVLLILLAVGLLSGPLPIEAQQAPPQPAGRPFRLGHLGHGDRSTLNEAFHRMLTELGYVEGQNVVVEYRYADGRIEELRRLAADLVRLQVDVIVANGTPASLTARDTTTTIPVVMVGVGSDPVALRLVRTLARPAGNVTGVVALGTELWGKRLELLREVVPGKTHLAVLSNPTNPGNLLAVKEINTVIPATNFKLRSLVAQNGEELDRAVMEIGRRRPDALVLIWDAFLLTHARRIADVAVRHRIPTLSPIREYVNEGALLSYGANAATQWRRAAHYVDKILKGANPGEIPVEQAAQFEFVINLKTAKALGLTIPPSLLLRADHVIQ